MKKSSIQRSFGRHQRVEDVIHKSIAEALQNQFKDPRVGMITVMDVKITLDLKFARIYISVLDEEQSAQTLAVLNYAVGFFRSILAKQLKLRVVPELRFMLDETGKITSRMDQLFNQMHDKSDA